MFPATLALFCKVVDNFGDIGICWRLARQLQHEHGVNVTLWVDDLHSFQRICPQVVPDAATQQLAGVTVRHWRDQQGMFSVDEVADIVIEFFAVDIPPNYIAAMASCQPHPVWLNLEGLTAEDWVEGCHALSSPQARSSLTKYFFFPGFTDKTGGLLHETSLEAERRKFQSDQAGMAAFLARLGLSPAEMAGLKVSLFCYPHAPVTALFAAWEAGEQPITCLVPEGVAVAQIEAFLGCQAGAGTVHTRGALTVRVLPFVAQPDYDRLLWACDVNFVRGEDSFVRAQWAGKPFVWHIYPQDENLHHKKLRAFLQRYAGKDGGSGENLAGMDSLTSFSLRWNEAGSQTAQAVLDAQKPWAELWSQCQADLPQMMQRAADWQEKMLANGDLASNMLKFARSIRPEAEKNSV